MPMDWARRDSQNDSPRAARFEKRRNPRGIAPLEIPGRRRGLAPNLGRLVEHDELGLPVRVCRPRGGDTPALTVEDQVGLPVRPRSRGWTIDGPGPTGSASFSIPRSGRLPAAGIAGDPGAGP